MLSLRKKIILALLVCILVGARIRTYADQRIEDLAKDRLSEISFASAQSVPRDQVQSLWNDIEYRWGNSELPLRIGHPAVEPSAIIRERMRGLVADLIARDAIKVLTPEIKAKLESEGVTCKLEGHCTSVDGIYLPLNHLIYLDVSLSRNDLLRVFLHELFHAYQFTYRFPIDIATLSGLVQEEKLKSEEVNLYLDYYYESQANWKGMQFEFPLPWLMEIDNELDQNLRVGLSRLLVQGGVAAGATFIGNGATAGVGLLIYGAGWLLHIAYGNATANRLLPDVAKSESLFTIDNTPHNKLSAAAILPELIPIDESLNRFSGFASYNFEFHQEYGAAIQKTYFGKDRFLFRNDRNDLEIYNKLHNGYYARIGLNLSLESDPACQDLLTKVRSSSESPLVTWLTLSKAEIESCAAYRDLGDDDGRAKYLEDLLNPQNQKDPFHTGFPGTEGTRPGLTVLPQLRVLPIK